MHGYVFPTDYSDSKIKHQGFFAIDSSLKKDENTLLIDGGDTIQGSPFTTYLHEKIHSPTIIAEAMNQMGYNYVTLGNHDFNYGYDYLNTYIGQLNATVLCANVVDTENNHNFIENQVIHTMPNNLKIGIIGMTTDFINRWESPANLMHFKISDPYEAAKKALNILKNKVDLVIGIYHGGFEQDITSHRVLSKTTENIAYKLCQTLPFDLLLTGHQHIPISNATLHGTHIVQTPMNGLQYAKVTIAIDSDKPAVFYSELLTPSIDTDTLHNYDCWQDTEKQVQTWLDQRIGVLDTKLIPQAHLTMAIHGNLIANFLNQIQLEVSGADVSCTSLANQVFGLNKNVTLRDIVTTYKYPNTLFVLEITGTLLKKALEQAASYFENNDGKLQISEAFIKPKIANYNYDYFSGITYTINTTKAIGTRIEELFFRNMPVEDEQVFKLVMNNYRASGAGNYEFYEECPILKDIQISTTDMVIDYIKQHPHTKIDQTHYYKVLS